VRRVRVTAKRQSDWQLISTSSPITARHCEKAWPLCDCVLANGDIRLLQYTNSVGIIPQVESKSDRFRPLRR